MPDYLNANRQLWNEWTGLHVRSTHYDFDGLRAGKITLAEIDRAEVGDVAGKSLLHLMCHMGLEKYPNYPVSFSIRAQRPRSDWRIEPHGAASTSLS
jgi:hypothetical protein